MGSERSAASAPLWWQAFEAERRAERLRDAARVLQDAPALDAFGAEAAKIADEILMLVSHPSAVLTAREWRAVQEQAARLLALARLAEAYASRV